MGLLHTGKNSDANVSHLILVGATTGPEKREGEETDEPIQYLTSPIRTDKRSESFIHPLWNFFRKLKA
ncbi:hypothetical protein CEXT_454751 [Caerostris extrusa]|uniref:Ycf15 n=1 Tax=Caerostris extrusa TaxID=172846 RepID=A0AAV4Y231_CAEEX|nr:hypothetical protein CEXT_454751 [Caerostris extrusa]